MISVRQTRDLPRASFRFRIATDTLAFSYVLTANGHTQDFHLLEFAHAGRTKNALPYEERRLFNLMHNAANGTRTHTSFLIRPSSVRVCQFRHGHENDSLFLF